MILIVSSTEVFACYSAACRPPGSGGTGGSLPMYHGSPSGDLRGGHYGVHVGTKQAALEALNARIGTPVVGEWDGTREYGKTLLAGSATLFRRGGFPSGYANERGSEDYFPTGDAVYSDGTKIPLTVKPTIFAVRIIGKMTNTPQTPHNDWKANGYMAGNVKKGRAKSGYYYVNEGEDAGSISAVVPPGGAHLERITD